MRFAIVLGLLLLSVQTFVLGQASAIRDLKKRLPQVRDSTHYVDVLNRISLLFYEQNADSTLQYATLAKNIALRLDYDKGVADANNNLGIVYDLKGNTQVALRYYNDAFNQYTRLADSSNIVQTLMNIAMVYNVSGRHDKAIANFENALDIGNRISHDSITAMLIYNYILLYPDHFKGSARNESIEKAKNIAFKYKDLRMQLAIDQILAEDLLAAGNQQAGIALLKKTLEKSQEMQLLFFSMDLMIHLGDLHIQHDPETGLQYYFKALEISEAKVYRQYAHQICVKLTEYYHQKSDTANAFIYSQKLVKLFEEQSDIDRGSGIDYIEYAVKDQELKSVKLTSSYNSRLLWLAIAVCILTILSILFLWRNWMLTRKTNSVLKMQFRQLESTTEALEQSNQNFAQLIKVIAHDLRNPIGAIKSLSAMLLEEKMNEGEPEQFHKMINQASDSCLKLISELLETDFNLRESELIKEKIDLPDFMEQIVKLFSFRAAEKNQELVLKETAGITLFADRDKLSRVLSNLIVNSFKFSPEGGKVELASESTGDTVTISIRDHGVGIPEDHKPRIFDPFTSSKRQGTAGEQPFGLGLYITKQIVEAHHGRIWFESEAGNGSTFYVQLPLEVLPEA